MEPGNGCALFNAVKDKISPASFLGEGHVHIVVLSGELTFSDGKHIHQAHADDLIIWQMSNTISQVSCSSDFDADILVASPDFLQEFNPEMVWASKGFIFIKTNPVFHLDDASKRLIVGDFDLFKARIADDNALFNWEILGRIMYNPQNESCAKSKTKRFFCGSFKKTKRSSTYKTSPDVFQITSGDVFSIRSGLT